MAHAEQIFRDLLTTIAAKQKFANYDIQVTPFSTCGANYTSDLFLATVSEGQRVLDVFAKVAAIGEKLRAQVPMKMYDTERFFYTNLAKVYRQLEEKNHVPEEHKVKFPEFYGCSEKLYEETIVLENLSSKGFTTYDRFKSVEWDYAASAVTELAKYHALSVAYQVDDPEGSAKVIADLKYEIAGDEDLMRPFWESVVGKAVEATKEENKDKLKKFFGEDFRTGREIFIEYYAPVKLAVIGHGDYRLSNMMHRVKEDGSLEVVAVDYQTLRAGCPVTDLLYFIFTGTDAKFRAHYYEKLIDHYYVELSAAMTRLGLNPEERYSRDDYEFELKEKVPFGLAVAVFTLPIVTVEAEHAPKVDHSMELSDFNVQTTGSLFPERLNGVVDDFVRWGVL